MVEKLSKALEGLKNIHFTAPLNEANLSKKEKMFFCVLAADVMVSLNAKNTSNLPVIIENMINMCDDKDTDVRMVADESLNRIITSLPHSNMLKVQMELHNIIKRNGPARCLRGALTRFGQLSHYIRPNKGKTHAQMLIPALIEVAKREEESVHETLASSIENIFKVLGVFAQDNALKGLIKAFLHNLSSTNPVIRRCSSSCIITIVQYCRKPLIFNCYVLNSLLDCVVPICEGNSADLILGVLGCLRLLLPTLVCMKNDEGISGSFGLRKRPEESILSVDRLIQAYELCLHYTNSKDHNVVAAALETLNHILQNPLPQLESFFLSPAGFSRSYVHSTKESRLWSRSGSEMSVAFSLPPPDEALLLEDTDVDLSFSAGDHFGLKDQNLDKFKYPTVCSEEEAKIVESPFKVQGKTSVGQSNLDVDSDTESVATSDSIAPTNFLMRLETEEKELEERDLECCRSDSQEELYSPCGSDKLDCSTVSCQVTKEVMPKSTYIWKKVKQSKRMMNSIDVGTFTDTAVPLIYCARHLSASFLLEGSPNCLKSDKNVRVSIKSLALTCLSAITKLYPVIMKMSLAKNKSELALQEMSDVFLYCDHSDPQIRGNVSILVGSFLNSALSESKNFASYWLSEENSNLNCENLIKILLKGLSDESSVCTRQALMAFKFCINRALYSVYNIQFLPLLEFLPALTCNSYWLVKVKLVEVLSDLPYVCICDLNKSNVFQEEVIDSVLLPLLGDQDARVRCAVAEAFVRIIPALHNGKSTVLEYGKPFAEHLDNCMKIKIKSSTNQSPCLPFSAIFADPDENIEYSLSIIVAKLTYSLLVPKDKYTLFGYLEALKLLSEKYSTTLYSKAWNCAKAGTAQGKHELTSNLINVVLASILTSPFGLDLTAFSNATFLLGNLFAGLSISYLKENVDVSRSSSIEKPMNLWDVFSNSRVSQIAEEILAHLLKVLNSYDRLVEEVTLSSVAESSTAANAFLPFLSPIKKPDKKPEEKSEEKKAKVVNAGKQSTRYSQLQQLLGKSYTNYKVSLDKTVGDKFVDLLDSTLYALSVLLEVATVRETGRCAEEILSYLLSVVSLRPSSAVICIMQLLKSLFGTNLGSGWEQEKFSSPNLKRSNLFEIFFHLPTELLAEKIRSRVNSNAFECEALPLSNRRIDRKITVKNSDKNSLASYIRLFEPTIVKSLQLYTITRDVELQANVLRLLNQLIQLRVNYCMLDGKQIFLDFVLKQFELIERGQIPGVEILLPHIFKFLILLSYEKQHSKPIMSIPKIIQLCDGLMASDQSVETHCIPSLIPVVEDVFLSRSLVTSVEEKELETQREVLFSMLLRLVEFPEVMNMLDLILSESRSVEERNRWRRWSRQVVDVLVPLASQDRLRIESAEGQKSFARLMSSLSPNVLRPINPLLKALFVEPGDYNCSTSIKRWLSKVTVLLETVLYLKEDALLSRLEETRPNINLTTFAPGGNLTLMDPFHVKSFFSTFEPPETFARFILKVISIVVSKILDSSSSDSSLQQKFSSFFICIFHILKSGTFHRITKSLQSVFVKERDSLTRICSAFLTLAHVSPILSCQFSYFLTLLNYCDQSYWSEVVRPPSTLSAKLVQSCGVVSLCDHLCDNFSDTETFHFLIKNCLEELIAFSHEIPVKELLLTMHRRTSEWSFLLKSVSSKSFDSFPPHFLEKLLRLLEITESSHSGTLLALVLRKFLGSPRLALSLLAGSIACRQVEHLLTLPREKVLEQIEQKEFEALLNIFRKKNYFKRHSTLASLLEKLSLQVFNSTPSDLDINKRIPPDQIKHVQLEEIWYFSQVKQRCCHPGLTGNEIPILLGKLSSDKILEIMFSSEFNIKILKDCFCYSQTVRQKYETQAQDNRNEELNDCLYKASKARLLGLVREIGQALEDARKKWPKEEVLEKTSASEGFQLKFWEMANCLTSFLEIVCSNQSEIESDSLEGIAECGVTCLLMLNGEMRKCEIYPEHLDVGVKCCGAVLRNRQISNLVSTKENSLKEWIENTFNLVSNLIARCRLSKIAKTKRSDSLSQSDQLDFLLTFVMTKSSRRLLPNYLRDPVRDLVVNLCRIPPLSSQVLAVPEGCDLQDIEFLKSFISRFSTIGWTSRQQFEEIWVSLLSVLGFNTQGDVPQEDNGFIVQASTVAVEGMTALLKNTMLDKRSKALMHHGRDSLPMKNVYEKLPVISVACKKENSAERAHQFLDNLEVCQRDERYIHGLLSVEYLWTAVKQISSRVDLYERHSRELSDVGLDLPSCIHLLIELYNQWISQASPDIKIVTSSLKSSLVISDLFTDIGQFQWMLDFCLRVDEIAIPDDSVILPLVILGCCKACAVVLPNEEVCEKVKKLMLRSKSLPCRISVVEGLLYLLQSYIVCYAVNHTALPPPGSAFQTDEANFVANVVDTFLPVALEIVDEFRVRQEPATDEYDRCHWSLIFYLLQHYQSSLGDLKDEFLSLIISTLCSKNCPLSVLSVLIRGSQRLILSTVVEENFLDQLAKVSLEIISNTSLAVALNGLQLLSVLSFLDKRMKDIRQLVTGQDDPERVMKDMEKVNVLFEKLKRSYPKEAEVVGHVIAYVVMDFTASDVLTKVIQEFLFPHQPHQKILAGLLFKVFERAEKNLLQDWVVFSLPGLIQGLPLAMSVWTLNCFFVSATDEPWLRSIFPLVQSRARMVEPEDKKLLCLSAARFYGQLQQESQRKSFVQTFQKADAIDTIFIDLLSAIS